MNHLATEPPRGLTADFAARFIIDHLKQAHGARFTGSRRPQAPVRAAAERLRLAEETILEDYQLYGVRQSAQLGLRGWIRGGYPIKARPDIPSPAEMLDLQCEGKRFATILTAPSDQQKIFGRHRGAVAFLLHDLEHAQKFFGHAELYRGQHRFFLGLRLALEHPGWLAYDGDFAVALDYVKSDMNSHPLHMFKYLKAIVLEAHRRLKIDRFEETFADLVAAFCLPPAAARRINRPGAETIDDQLAITRSFLDF